MDKYNAERYIDLTPYKALTDTSKEEKNAKIFKPLVYIASPFAGDTEYNTRKVQGYCRFAMTKGCIPLAPHLHYPQFMDDSDKEEREQGLFFALVLLGKCDELWVFGENISNGMKKEVEKALKRGIPIRRFNSRFQEIIINNKMNGGGLCES